MKRRKELPSYKLTNLRLPKDLVGVIATPKNILLKESSTAYMIAWKIYEKVKKAIRKAPLRVKVKYPRIIPNEEIIFALIPLAQSMLSNLAIKYNMGFIVSLKEVLRKRKDTLSTQNIGELIILPINKNNSSSITFMPVYVIIHKHSNTNSYKQSIHKPSYKPLMDVRRIVSKAGYDYYYIAEKPLVLMDIFFSSLEDIIRVVIEDGVETINIAFPLREPKWSLSSFPENMVKELERVVINPIRSSAKYAIKGLIVIGPPGVGKSVLVEALARKLGLRILDLSPGAYRSMWYGLTEKILLKLFEKLKKRRDLIILVDDAEFLSMRARSIHEVHLSEITMLLNVLQRSDRPLIAFTSNQPDIIDPALLRPGRIDLVIIMGYPNLEFRKIIIKELLRRYAISYSSDHIIEYIAKSTRWFTNAEIDALIRLAASIGNGVLSEEVVDKARRKFKINEGERRRMQEYLEWYASRLQGIVLTYVSKEDEI